MLFTLGLTKENLKREKQNTEIAAENKVNYLQLKSSETVTVIQLHIFFLNSQQSIKCYDLFRTVPQVHTEFTRRFAKPW